jgi:hypothetical protein
MLLSKDDNSINPSSLNSFLTNNGGYYGVSDDPVILTGAIANYPNSDLVYNGQVTSLVLSELKTEIDNATPVLATEDGASYVIIYGYQDNGENLSDFVFYGTNDCDGFQVEFIDENTSFQTYMLFDNFTDPNNTDDDGDGYTENDGDCNDDDITIYPGAPEICGDGIDQDCDGEIDEGCSPAYSGEAHYYTMGGAGICNFPEDYENLYAAVSEELYDNSALCGACILVSGPDGSAIVKVVDLNPDASNTHDLDTHDLDLSYEAFDLIGNPNHSPIPVSWEIVSCESTNPISYFCVDGSNEFWFGLTILNHSYPISTLEVLDNASWVQLGRDNFNRFIGQSLGLGPFDFRITDTNGNVIIEEGITLISGEVVTGTQLF